MNSMNMSTAISTLHLEGYFTPSDVRRQWRELVKQFHPDRVGENEAFYAINRAYEYLRDYTELDTPCDYTPVEYYMDHVYIIDWSAFRQSGHKFQRGSTRHKAFWWLAENDQTMEHKNYQGGYEEGWNRCTKENAMAAGIDPAALRSLIKRGYLRIEERKIRVDIRDGF